jgi:hypothetical protein
MARNNKTFNVRELRQLVGTGLVEVTVEPVESWQDDIHRVIQKELTVWKMMM